MTIVSDLPFETLADEITLDELKARVETVATQFVSTATVRTYYNARKHICTVEIPQSEYDQMDNICATLEQLGVDAEERKTEIGDDPKLTFIWEHEYTDEFEQLMETVSDCLTHTDIVTATIQQVTPNESVVVRGSYNAQNYPEVVALDSVRDVTDSIKVSGYDVSDMVIHSGVVSFNVSFDDD